MKISKADTMKQYLTSQVSPELAALLRDAGFRTPDGTPHVPTFAEAFDWISGKGVYLVIVLVVHHVDGVGRVLVYEGILMAEWGNPLDAFGADNPMGSSWVEVAEASVKRALSMIARNELNTNQ